MVQVAQGPPGHRPRPDNPSAAGPDPQILLISQPYRAGSFAGPDNGYAIGFSAVTPASPGTVRLASPDPSAGPLIDPDYLGDERDVAVMTEGLRIARLIGSRDVLAGVRGDEAQPGAGASTTQAPAESALTICRPWTPSCASTGSRDCASPTHPSCRRPSRPTPTPPSSRSPRRPPRTSPQGHLVLGATVHEVEDPPRQGATGGGAIFRRAVSPGQHPALPRDHGRPWVDKVFDIAELHGAPLSWVG